MQACFLERPAFPNLYRRSKALPLFVPMKKMEISSLMHHSHFNNYFLPGYLAAYLFILLSCVGAVLFALYSIGTVRNATYSSGTESLRQGQL